MIRRRTRCAGARRAARNERLVRMRLRTTCEELRRSPEWVDEESYGPFAARWRWRESSSWEPFVRMHRRDRGALHREV